MKETRELQVSVTLRIPLAGVLAMYVDAITPDGGYLGTSNAWIKEYAEGVMRDMERADLTALGAESTWRLA